MERKNQIKQAARNISEEFSDCYFKFIQGAQWADNNPTEEHIAAYIDKKGWPLSSQVIPTYEQTNKMMMQYYEYKKKQWIDEACECIKKYAPIDYDCEGFVDDFRKTMEVKNV